MINDMCVLFVLEMGMRNSVNRKTERIRINNRHWVVSEQIHATEEKKKAMVDGKHSSLL